MNDNNVYTITTRMNREQKDKIESISKNLGISISATVKVLTNMGIKSLETISTIQ